MFGKEHKWSQALENRRRHTETTKVTDAWIELFLMPTFEAISFSAKWKLGSPCTHAIPLSKSVMCTTRIYIQD